MPIPRESEVVTRTACRLVPGTPRQLLAWQKTRLKPAYQENTSGVSTVRGQAPAYGAGFSVPAVPGLFDFRERGLGAVSADNGQPAVTATATLTSPGQVAALAGYLNGLSVDPDGSTSCPAATGGSLTVTFRARAGGPALAQAAAALTGCPFLSCTMPGRAAASVGGDEAGHNLLAEINHVAGLHWKAA